MSRVPSEGIVTAGDSGVFLGVRLLIESLRRTDHHHPILVCDIGLTSEQSGWCAAQPGVSVLPFTEGEEVRNFRQDEPIEYLGFHVGTMWQAWMKPFYVAASTFDRVLWLDSDLVVQGSLEPVFRMLDHSPVFVDDLFMGYEKPVEFLTNPPQLYEICQVPATSRPFLRELFFNSGVVGLARDRDRDLIEAWMESVSWAAKSEKNRELIRFHDQGSLLWAIHKTGQQSGILKGEKKWNWPAEKNFYGQFDDILDLVKQDHPEATIVHWMARPKLWDLLRPPVERVALAEPYASFVIDFRAVPLRTARRFIRLLELREAALLPLCEAILLCHQRPASDFVSGFGAATWVELPPEGLNPGAVRNAGVYRARAPRIVLLKGNRVLPEGFFTRELGALVPGQVISPARGHRIVHHVDDFTVTTGNYLYRRAEGHRLLRWRRRMAGLWLDGCTLLWKDEYLQAGGMNRFLPDETEAQRDLLSRLRQAGAQLRPAPVPETVLPPVE